MTKYIWSIDDSGAGGAEMVASLTRTVEFFDSRGLGSTWFTIPKAGGKPMTGEWKDALIAARDAGHDIQLHGLTHADCYEFGPPAWPATSILPTLQSEFDGERERLLPRYTVERLRERIEEGLEIFGLDLGVEPNVFRAPCGAISKPMFTALREVGIGYHTCMYISGSGYFHLPHNGGEPRQEWVDNIPCRPFRWYDDIVEVPILNEYTWRGAGEHSEAFVALARSDLDRISGQSPVVALLMHTHGIASDYEHTFRMIDAVSDHVGRQSGSSFTTFYEAAASGALDDAATEQGPDLLTI